MGRFLESHKSVMAFAPKDITGAGVDGDRVHLKDFRRLAIILNTGAWAGGTAAVTLEKSKSAAGGSETALAFDTYYISTLNSSDTPVATAVTSNTFNLSAANKQVVIEVDAQDLVSGGYTHVRVRVASPGANADLLGGTYVLFDGGYAGDPATLPSVID